MAENLRPYVAYDPETGIPGAAGFDRDRIFAYAERFKLVVLDVDSADEKLEYYTARPNDGEDLTAAERLKEWAIRGDGYPYGVTPPESHRLYDDIRAVVAELEEQPAYEYGVRRPLSEENWGPGHYSTAEYETREEAVADMEYFDVKNGTLVRRTKAGEWEEVK